jgi:hypothetical protein
MNAYASSSADGFSRRVEELIDTVDYELRGTVAYIDRVIVPEVRREAGGAARVLAGHLDRLAEKLHPQGKRGL